jgi:hypothetical protein
MDTKPTFPGSDRGAVLVHTALAMLALVAFTTFVADYGAFWLSRRQAQNSADAGALAGAITLLTDLSDEPTARDAAHRLTQVNLVYGQSPNVIKASDITFPVPGAPGCPDSAIKCVQVDVYRTQARANPLPVFFGPLVGVMQQDIQATATAQVANGDAADCIRPFAVPQTDPPYDLNDDIGTTLELHPGGGGMYDPGWFLLLDIVDDGKAGGANETKDSIRSCISNEYGLGDPLPQEMGEEASIRQAVEDLIALDEFATVVGTAPNVTVNSPCITAHNCQFYQPDGSLITVPTATVSPRVIPIPVFDPDVYLATGEVILLDIFGFFLLPPTGPGASGQIISGIIVTHPGVLSNNGENGLSSFLRVLTLTR